MEAPRLDRSEQHADGAPLGLFSPECLRLRKKQDVGQGEQRNLSKVPPKTERRGGRPLGFCT